MTQDQKDKLIEAFESIVLPMIPSDWLYGDVFTLSLKYDDSDGWMLEAGRIANTFNEYLKLEETFDPLLKEISKPSREGLDISSGFYSVRYDRITKSITEKCQWYTEVLAYSIN